MKKELKEIAEGIARLEEKIMLLSKKIDERMKPTISQATTKESEAVPYAKIIDEWINGVEDDTD